MSNLTEVSNFDAAVNQIDDGTDQVSAAVTNLAPQALANRTKWLKAQVDSLLASRPFRGALVYNNSAAPSAGIISWGLEQYDTDAIHSTVTNTSRLTVPAGVTKVIVKAKVAQIVSGTAASLHIYKNGSTNYIGGSISGIGYSTSAFTSVGIQAETPILSVIPGDYFEIINYCSFTLAADTNGYNNWAAMEIIE